MRRGNASLRDGRPPVSRHPNAGDEDAPRKSADLPGLELGAAGGLRGQPVAVPYLQHITLRTWNDCLSK